MHKDLKYTHIYFGSMNNKVILFIKQHYYAMLSYLLCKYHSKEHLVTKSYI